MTSVATIEHAPAKINLALHVLRRRADGFHDIDSLVVFAGIGDGVEFVPADDRLELTVDGPFADALAAATAAGENLVVRAAQAIGEFGGTPPTGRLRLTKNLPIAAGIGGGSADAAATLRLLGRIHGMDDALIGRLARPLGADVPMCLTSAPLRATDDGNALSGVSMPALPMVLAYPAAPASTAKVFGRLATPTNAPLPAFPPSFQAIGDVVDWLKDTRNDLERAARAEAPIIDRTLADLANLDASLLARMSGSGSTCFALFPTLTDAETAAHELQSAHPNWWVQATMTSGV